MLFSFIIDSGDTSAVRPPVERVGVVEMRPMDHRKRWTMKRWAMALLALVFGIALAACEEAAPESAAPTLQGGEAGSLPTRTVKPIVSFTPRFTATPLPSLTFTPSVTPRATETPVPPSATPTEAPSPTPTVEGEIRSTENVNLRVGPGLNSAIARTVRSGTQVGVIGMQTDAEGRLWYKVVLTGESGEEERLWVLARLVRTDYETVVAQPIVIETPEPGAGGAALVATPGTPAGPLPTLDGNRVDVLAYCRQKGVRAPRITTADSVYIEWSWFVARPEYMDEHLENATYEVRLDGQLLDNWRQAADEMKQESGVWITYWYYPVGRLAAGEHEVTYRVTWDEQITDGYGNFGPGTGRENETGDCHFTVTEAG